MTKNDLIDKTLDVILYYTAPMAEKDILDELPSIDELNEQISFSKEHKKKMGVLFRKQRFKGKMLNLTSYAKKAAVCLLIISIIVGTISYFNVEAFRIEFLNLMLNFKEGYLNILVEDAKPDTEKRNTFILGNVEFGYIPDGFEIETNISNEFYEFSSVEKPYLYFSLQIMLIESNITTDTEDGFIAKIIINGNDALLFKKNNEETNLIWHSGDKMFSLSGNIIDSEIILIAENLKVN